jgi:small-conductance mechanosensitive channel
MESILDSLGIPAFWHNTVSLGLWIVVIWLANKVIKKWITGRHLENESRYRVNKAITFAAYVIILIIAIVTYSSQLGGFTVALGVAGAGIAFALQEVIASFAGWLALLLGTFFKPGDRVQLGGIKGDVIDIGILRTTLMETGEWVDGDLYNGRIVRIANSFVFKEPVFNYSSDFPFLWDEIKIPISHGSDYEKARAIFTGAVLEVTGDFSREAASTWSKMKRKYRVENATTEPMVTLTANDNWIEFTVRYAVDFKRRRITKDKLFTAILNSVRQSAGLVTLASSSFQVTTLPVLSVSLKKD